MDSPSSASASRSTTRRHLFALLSLGARPLDGLFWLLGFLGIAVTAWGVVEFNRFF